MGPWMDESTEALEEYKGRHPGGAKASSSGSPDSVDRNQMYLFSSEISSTALRRILFWKDLGKWVNLNPFKDAIYGVRIFFRQCFSLC